jgi:hypothetical protein
MFSDVDLSFSAADQFDFGGRVHTNSNLFLAQGGTSSDSLILRDKVTAFREIVRQRLSNGESIDTSGSTRTVSMAKAPGSFRTLARTEGSVTDTVSGAKNPSWPTISLSTYNGYIRNGLTGVKRLDLPLITTGGANVDLIRRPALNENVTLPNLFGERYFSKVSLRILLSDTANDITTLPGVTATAPILLDGNWVNARPAGYAPAGIDAARPPIARSLGALHPVAVTVTAAVTAGSAVTIPVSVMPDYFKLPLALTITKGAVNTVVNCTGRTATTFTGCTSTPANTASIALPATISGTVTTPDGVVVPVSTPLTVGRPSNAAGQTVTVASTAPFAPNNFFFVTGTNSLIHCTGYTTAPALTGCNVPANIANNATLTTGARSLAGTGTIGGYIKIEMQDTNSTWRDVTLEVLNFGISGPNLVGKGCGDPSPNAIVRLQRLRDNNEAGAGTCSYAGSLKSTDHWPNVLFDTREAVSRDASPGATLALGGVIHYINIDATNLSRWFAGTLAGSGNQALSTNGYSVYISDRRNNRDAVSRETGEYGFEDFVNPASATGAPNGVLDAGEDLNGNGTLETYGQFPSYGGVASTAFPPVVGPGGAGLLDASARPWTGISGAEARVNRALLFRRAVKLTNGQRGNLVAPGLTIAAENPVYVQGNWNADAAGFGDPHVATSVAADAVTMLSGDWNDGEGFDSPYNTAGRPRASDTYYRLAVISGKGPIFPRPTSGAGATYGTDGGAHSFLRFLEGAGGGNDRINYRGSMVTFFYNRQAVTPFKCCGGVVYDVPTRAYAFDIDFLDPAKLPPLTPVFRDLNALGFEQETRPGR